MRFLLDTNLLSEMTKDEPDPGVRSWLKSQPEQELAVSALSFGEIHFGIHLLADGRKKSRLRRWLDRALAQQFSGRVLPVDEAVSLEWGRLAAQARVTGRAIETVDALLVATAIVRNLTIVTRDARHCAGWGAPHINPWSG